MKKEILMNPGLEDEKIYNILIISLILGLIIVALLTFFFRITLYEKKEPFTELYFSDPEGLPNQIKYDKNYNYSFVIKSNEKETKNYTYSTNLELYNIYDRTEEKFSCLSNYRNKIFFDWTNETNNFSLNKQKKMFEEIDNLVVFPDYNENINWSQYTIDFKFGYNIAEGQLIIFFANETDVKYYIIIDHANNRILFNDKEVIRGINVERQNNFVTINIKGNEITMYLNDEKVMDKQYLNLHNGQIGFESQDSYYTISNLKVYETSPIVIPDNKNKLKEYNIEDNFLFNKIYETKELRSKSVPLSRTYQEWQEKIDCDKDPFYCEYFGLKNDISFLLENINLTKAVEKVPVVDQYRNYVLFPVFKEKATIDWKEFNFNFSYQQFKPDDNGIIIIKFEDKWAIMISRNNSYFMIQDENDVLIDEIKNPLVKNETKGNVLVSVNPNNIILKIKGEEVFVKDTPKDYTNGSLSLYMKNTFLEIDPIQMINLDTACNDPYKFNFCELILDTSRQIRTKQSLQQYDFRVDYYEHDRKENKFNLLEYINKNETLVEQENVTENETFSEQIGYEINLPITNPFIPDKRFVFNEPTIVINNYNEFSLEYSYETLDGAGVMELGLMDFNENEIISMYVIEKENKVVVFHPSKIYTTLQEVLVPLRGINRHKLELKLNNGVATFKVDGKEVYALLNTNIKSGYFFIGSRNTYSEIDNVYLRIGDRELSKNIKVQDNECDFKLIYKEVENNETILESGQIVKINKMFNVTKKFDYGKMNVELFGSSFINKTANESLEIHFWVIRDDN